ncbi:RNA polymerase sigma factor [Intestinibacillus massiliensis]|nr:RNA polymerase sigma factor [Intestinibacillus massiliensis]
MEHVLRTDAFLSEAMAAHGDAVYRLALCRMQRVQDAEDVYQEVFLRLLRDPTEFDGDGHLKAWLLRVTLNCCHSLWRSPWQRRAPLVDQAVPPPQDEQAAALWEAVAALPAHQRTAVHLYYAEGYRTEEIAQLTGCSAATVRTRLHRARTALKGLLEGGTDDGQEEPLPQPAAGHSPAR